MGAGMEGAAEGAATKLVTSKVGENKVDVNTVDENKVDEKKVAETSVNEKKRTGATKVMPLVPRPLDLSMEVEKLRADLKQTIKSEKNLRSVFAKIDADGFNSMSKQEFEKLIREVLKPHWKPAPEEELFDALWCSVRAVTANEQGGTAELSVLMLCEWLFDEERGDAQILADTLQETNLTVKIAFQKEEEKKRLRRGKTSIML